MWKLYEKLPDELREAIFSAETADNIWDICDRNEAEEVSKVAKYTGYVLVGVLSPDEFQKTLEEEVGLEKETAKKVAQEINRFVFYPVKTVLEEIYKVPIAPPPVTARVVPPTPEAPSPEEKPPTPPGEDIYREPIE